MENILDSKICSNCKELKQLDEFYSDKSKKDGRHSICKICTLSKKKEYHLSNREIILKKKKDYYIANRDNILIYGAEYRKSNEVQLAEYHRQYREEHRDSKSKYNREYREQNKDRLIKYISEYKTQNIDRINYLSAKRRALKNQATPKWLSEEQLDEIQSFYTIAKLFQIYDGNEYHVDHIIPLNNSLVCGLHVPWNLQVLSATDNLIKSNKFEMEF